MWIFGQFRLFNNAYHIKRDQKQRSTFLQTDVGLSPGPLVCVTVYPKLKLLLTFFPNESALPNGLKCADCLSGCKL